MNFLSSASAGNFSEIAVAGGGAATHPVFVHVRRVAEAALAPDFQQARYSKLKLILAGASGLVTTSLGIGLAFFPAQQITSLFSYEVWMWGGTVLFIGAAAFFYFVYGGRKAALKPVA